MYLTVQACISKMCSEEKCMKIKFRCCYAWKKKHTWKVLGFVLKNQNPWRDFKFPFEMWRLPEKKVFFCLWRYFFRTTTVKSWQILQKHSLKEKSDLEFLVGNLQNFRKIGGAEKHILSKQESWPSLPPPISLLICKLFMLNTDEKHLQYARV